MATTEDSVTGDPMIGFHFSLEVSGKVNGYFTEVSGIGSETELIEHKIVSKTGEPLIRKVPGRLKWGDITLKRGITGSMDAYEWRKLVEQGSVDKARSNGSIIMYDQKFQPIAQWDFVDAWPSKISGPSLASDSNAVGIEEMTIVHEGIKRIK
ncbi:MAG: phage tail protein [Chloroflexi bacterium]|nr:phage tail protein [Chloroflexota bacterium]MCC6891509.1 phage tail protein [Anaerolineae bacterium]